MRCSARNRRTRQRQYLQWSWRRTGDRGHLAARTSRRDLYVQLRTPELSRACAHAGAAAKGGQAEAEEEATGRRAKRVGGAHPQTPTRLASRFAVVEPISREKAIRETGVGRCGGVLPLMRCPL